MDGTVIEVPYLSQGEITRRADSLLRAYSAARGWTLSAPVPVDRIAELHLRLTLSMRDLRTDLGIDDVLGAIRFADGEIIIDRRLDPVAGPENEGRYNFTLAHEIGHWELHRDVLFGHRERHRIHQPSYITRAGDSHIPVEVQANRFAAALLMPEPLVRAAFRTRMRESQSALDPRRGRTNRAVFEQMKAEGCWRLDRQGFATEFFSWIAEPIAARFKVSAQAMRIRLEQLGLLARPSASRC